MSAPAFCQARAKITTGLLRDVLHGAASKFAETFGELWTWRGRRVFALDGSKFNLARSEELDRHFGRPTSAHFPQATVSALVNVASALPCDVLIAPYGSCERKLLLQHLDVLQHGDVVVLDRGHPSHDVLRALLERKLDFLVRVPESSSFDAVEVFRQSGGNDHRVVIAPPKKRRGLEPIELRAVKLQKADDFDQRQFHARTALGVEQEILAQELFIVIARFLMATAAEHADVDYRDISRKSAVLGLAAYISRVCLDDPRSAATWLPRLLARIARTRDKRRAGRSFPRRSFKPGPRWGPTGRHGA